MSCHQCAEAAVTLAIEWWEDEEDENAINEQYQEWIAENYIDDEHLAWSYTDDDGVEHLFKIVAAEIESGIPLQEAFAVLHTCVDGVDNKTELVGVYISQEDADKALEILKANGEDAYIIGEIIKSEDGVVLC